MARSLNIVYGNYGLNFSESAKGAFERKRLRGNFRPDRLFFDFSGQPPRCKGDDGYDREGRLSSRRGAHVRQTSSTNSPASPAAKRGYSVIGLDTVRVSSFIRETNDPRRPAMTAFQYAREGSAAAEARACQQFVGEMRSLAAAVLGFLEQ